MPHLHLSLQAGSDLILKRMKRRHTRADALAACTRARTLRPDVAFGADLIAGFPTEGEDDFGATLDVIAQGDIAYLHVFPYSARPNTAAARMPQLPGPVISERAARLRDAGARALARFLDRQVGRTASVLVEGSGLGHTENFSPVHRIDAPRGTVLRTTLVARRGDRLEAA